MDRTLTDLLKDRAATVRGANTDRGWKYLNFYELVLGCGREMQPDENSPIELGLPKSCYWNCHELVSERRDLIYCEGFALSGDLDIPLAHAWVLNSEGKVQDPTWGSSGEAYLGVAFSWEWVCSLMESRRQRGKDMELSIFESNYLEGFSLLKEGLPPDAYCQL